MVEELGAISMIANCSMVLHNLAQLKSLYGPVKIQWRSDVQRSGTVPNVKEVLSSQSFTLFVKHSFDW